MACTNVEQDLARLAATETADMYWKGLATDGKERYVDALLVSPADALVGTFVAPSDGELYDRWAGRSLRYVYVACYPTTAQNMRADYVLPGGVVVPRMQRGDEAPLLPTSPARHPVLLLSHGYAGSPLGAAYRSAMLSLASWGYVTLAPFHGDLRYSVFAPDAPSQRSGYVPIWSEFVAMQSTRPLSASAGLDLLFAHPHWRDRLDAQRIGAFGISQGGETTMLLGGAQLTHGLFTLDSKRVTLDARIKAAVGYVPYFGADNLPAFGRDQIGAEGVTLPYLALSGTEDPIAPEQVARAALDRLDGVRGHVLLEGLGHDLDPTTAADIATWTQGFLAAFVLGDSAARAKLEQVERVDGGLADHKSMYVDPGSGVGGGTGAVVVDTVEYHNAVLDHYFITAFPQEIAVLDAGTDWIWTGRSFKTWQAGAGPGNDACRFYGTPGVGPNSHFYSTIAAECEGLKTRPEWTFEALAFRAVEPLASGCSGGYIAVTRLYNNGMGGDANHRYLADQTEVDRMIGLGWLSEGTVFCTPF